MSRWFEHPITNKTLEGDQVLNVLSYLNEAKQCFKTHYIDLNSNVSPLNDILKLWPEKSSVKKEWLRRVLDNGPMIDKIQSMGTVITEFPMHSLYYLDHLISTVNLNKKRFAITSSALITNIFANYLLPKTRPLINFNDRPLKMLIDMKFKNEKAKKNGIPQRDKILSFWYFEEQLKIRYTRFLKALEDLIKNEPDAINKIKILNLLFKLCQLKENQSIIVDILVNKLGDNNKKVSGSAFSKLSDIGLKDKYMLSKIVRATRKFIFRPNLSKKAQYYAVTLLSRCKIDRTNLKVEPNVADDNDSSGIVADNLALELVKIYIGVFKRLIDNGKMKYEKLYSALMAGLSRALKFTNGVEVEKYIDSVFRLVHSSNLNLSIQCLKVLYVIAVPKNNGTTAGNNEGPNFDRFLRLVYETILNSSLFFNSQKISMIDIFFKSLANDSDTIRVKTMVKRLLQLCLHHPEPGFVCVCLLFLSRLTDSKHKSIFERKFSDESGLGNSKVPVINSDNPNKNDLVESDDDNEIIDDIVSDNEELNEKIDENPKKEATTSWIHYQNAKTSIESAVIYNPFTRNPKYANADKETLVELEMLKNHYHPSVTIFVEKIFNMEKIIYNSDPSEDMSLARFLDRFAYKNPKKVEDRRKYLQKSATIVKDNIRLMPVNTKEFANLKMEKVPGDELFFHKYFNHARENKLGRVKEKIDSDFSDSDTEFDKFLMRENEEKDEYNMSGSDMGDIDDDLDFSDFTDEDDLEDFDENGVEQEDQKDDEEMSIDKAEDDENSEIDGNAMDQSLDEEEESNTEEETETIHSSKRKRLGPELANITTGALGLGKTFQNIKEKAYNQIKYDRKQRKIHKNKGPNRKINPKSKLVKKLKK